MRYKHLKNGEFQMIYDLQDRKEGTVQTEDLTAPAAEHDDVTVEEASTVDNVRA